MNIQLFLKQGDGNERYIHTLTKVSANPFKVGDVINLSVTDIYPRDLKDFKPETRWMLEKQHKNEYKLFHNKQIKLVQEEKYLDIQKDILIIEYFCEILHD